MRMDAATSIEPEGKSVIEVAMKLAITYTILGIHTCLPVRTNYPLDRMNSQTNFRLATLFFFNIGLLSGEIHLYILTLRKCICRKSFENIV